MSATIEKICAAAGIKPVIWEELKANQAKLEACSRPHEFSICLDRRSKQPIENPTPGQRFGAYWRCAKCGGQVDSSEKRHYERGLEDARKLKF